MLRSLKSLERYAVSATDGELGRVVDFYFDDDRWGIRYLVVEAGSFLRGRRVLITPISFREAEWSGQRFHVTLTMEQVRNSPSVDLDKPVSRQHERDLDGYYGYPPYWGSLGLWGLGGSPSMLAHQPRVETADERADDARSDVHLRSANEVCGYHIQGKDGPIGHVADFIVEDDTWEVRYLVVDTSNWWDGKKVLIAPHWTSGVSWEDRDVFIDMSREDIKSGPSWEATDPVNRELETRLYDYYGRPVYWASSGLPQESQPPPERRPVAG